MSQTVSSDSRREEQCASLITRACDMCRKKKIRCEATSEACLQCIKYKTQCHFTPISVKRKPRRPVGDKRVEKLEKRLKWMEDQLKRAVEGQQFEIDAESRNGLRRLETPSSDQSQAETSYLTQNIQGDDLLDPAFTIAGVSPQALDLGGPFQNASFATVPEIQMAIPTWNLTSVSNVFARRVFKVLPPKDEALNLIKKSFQGFNSAFPLFDQAAFMYTFESPDTNINDPDWWACLNVVLALTHRFRGATRLDRGEDREAWGYFQNALAVSNQLATMPSTLSSVQALLGMSIVLQGTPNPGPVSSLASSAIKLAQSMNLHRRFQEPGLSAAEIEQRKRVFWIAYSLDKDISLQTGQPPTQDDDNMDVELPFQNNGALTRPGEPNNADFFSFRARLAMIQGQIYTRLCSVKATKQSVTERVMAANELEAMLQIWRASVPIDFQQDSFGPNLQVPTSDPILHPVILQLAYFNSLATIYGSLPILPMYSKIQRSENPVEVHIMSAPITCAVEARKVIKLLQVTPQRNYACIWAVLHIFVSATTTLLKYTLSNPLNPLASADFMLIEPLLTLLYILTKSGRSDEVGELYRSCLELFKRARVAVRSLNLAGMSWDRRGTSEQSGGRESVEDFLRRMESISSGYDVDLSSISLAGSGGGSV